MKQAVSFLRALMRYHLFYFVIWRRTFCRRHRQTKETKLAIRWYRATLKSSAPDDLKWFAQMMIVKGYEALGLWSDFRGRYRSPAYQPVQVEQCIRNVVDRVLWRRDIPTPVKTATYRTTLFYIEPLPGAVFIPIEFQLPDVCNGMIERYKSLNPSILTSFNGGYTVICRSVNHNPRFLTIHPFDGIKRTRNFLLQYDKNLKLLSEREIIEDTIRPRFPGAYEGLEDCRLVQLKDRLWFIGASHDAVPGRQVQTLCRLSSADTADTVKVDRFVPLFGPNSKRKERNWLPFTIQGQLHAIYLYDPLMIFKIDEERGSYETVKRVHPDHDLSRFRGSAAPIQFDGGFLAMVHEVIFYDQKYYFHRFVQLDAELNIEKVSRPFIFRQAGIEYCCGMAIDHSQSKCVLTIGLRDQEAQFCIVDLDTVRSMLKPLPAHEVISVG